LSFRSLYKFANLYPIRASFEHFAQNTPISLLPLFLFQLRSGEFIMAHRDTAPYRAQDPQEIKELVQSLEAHSRKGKRGGGGFSVKKTSYVLPNRYQVNSWKMQDWDYKKPNLPTYARGLFTYKRTDGVDEIAVRGYDKFFNHGEVRKTEWANVQKNTRGPYELSVKENGCIIFIAGLEDDSLLICSKHSTGPRDDVDKSHAVAGERWVDKQLEKVGKTRADMARQLRAMNATAVAELCDDEFEEHVLAYTPDQAGLYLHGINLNLPEFATYPGPLVDKFADEWGFRKVMYLTKDDIDEVKSFLDKTAETGAYAGRDTEGFVIRCQARETKDSPYQDWFFKYKFEEPYLMYRQWRECTRAIIAGKQPRYKKHKKVTEEYLLYARRRFAKEPQLAKLYNQNHGIIKLRDDFLKDIGMSGSDIVRQEIERGEDDFQAAGAVTRNVILVPVATIGCGKTTVANALVKLFKWGHIQNDNIQGRGNRPARFATGITNLIAEYPVVIADRNNHQKRERAQIFEDVTRIIPDARYVALHWVHDRSNYDEIREATRDRVLSRGDNHQTIQAASKGSEEIIGIMEGFLQRFQPVDVSDTPDNAFDLVIDLDVLASSRDNLETVISKLHEEYPKLFTGEMPSADDLDDAIADSMKEVVDIKHDLSFKGDKNTKNKQKQHIKQSNSEQNGEADFPDVWRTKLKTPRLEFFAARLPNDAITSILTEFDNSADAETRYFYRMLQKTRRVQPEFHVTLMHRASAKENPEAWQKLCDLHRPKYELAVDEMKKKSLTGPEPEIGTCVVQLERLVWDDRVMCIVVRLADWESTNAVPHITIGTRSHEIKPKESNDLLARWLGGNEDGKIKEHRVSGTVVGSVRGVLQKY
jgi:tRNA ligase